MEYFDRRMALDMIEDALTDMDTPNGCGVATGLCGAFHMCGLISEEEWEAFLKRINAESYDVSTDDKDAGARIDIRVLN
jgi:hypothetical protein